IWWGPELVTLYNDACRPMLGTRKHPRALGRPGRECWLDVWSVIGPMLERALWRGERTFADDLLLPLDRHGRREEGYFTLSFSPRPWSLRNRRPAPPPGRSRRWRARVASRGWTTWARASMRCR